MAFDFSEAVQISLRISYASYIKEKSRYMNDFTSYIS
jgi:hypothetical protein